MSKKLLISLISESLNGFAGQREGLVRAARDVEEEEEVEEDEVEEVGWFPIEEAIRKLRHPSQKHTLNTLYRAISA